MFRSFVFLIITLSFLFTACLRLDDQFFNASKIDAYLMADYTGEVDFRLPPEFDISDQLIHWQQITSYAKDSQVNLIWTVFIGNQESFSSDTIILYCHGNRDHLDFYWPRIQLLAHTGGKHRYGVFAMDYQGFGLSQGAPSQEALIQDVQAAVDWLGARNVSPDRIVFYGFSLGSIPAVYQASLEQNRENGKIILEAPLNSSTVMVQDASTLSLPGSYVTDLDFNNELLIRLVNRPLLWIHGTQDETTSLLTHGEPVFHAHSGQFKQSMIVSGGTHSDLPVRIGYNAYLDSLASFISR